MVMDREVWVENILGDVDGGWDLFVWERGIYSCCFFLCKLPFSRTRTLTTTIRYAEQSPTSSTLVQRDYEQDEGGQPLFFRDSKVEG